MTLEATFIYIMVAGLLGVVSYFGYQKAKKDPENAGLEPGVILVRSFIKYSLTYFIVFQASAMLAEAALLGSVQEENMNVAARMGSHIAMAMVGAFGAFAMTKYFGSFISVITTKRPLGIWLGLASTTFMLSGVSLVLTIGSPIYNLMAMTNALHQGVQLEVWWASFQVGLGFKPQAYLDYVIALNKLPANYAPYDSLKTGMVTSLGLTAFHILITFWEILTVLMLALTHKGVNHALLGNLFDLVVDAPAKDSKAKDDAKDKKPKDDITEEARKAKDLIGKLLTYAELDKDVVASFSEKLFPYIHDKSTQQNTVANLAEAMDLLVKYESARNSSPQAKAGLRTQFQALVTKWTKGGLTLPKAAKKM
jgi:hypothetical protein